MRSKPATYLLVAGVVIVWGIIIWKILSPGGDAAQPPPAPAKTETGSDVADTLMLDYRDPFLGAAAQAKKAVVQTSRTTRITEPKPPEPEIEHNLRYRGKITKDNVAYGLVEIGGVLNTMKTGEFVDGYRMETLWQDSVRLKWRNKIIVVRRE